jgi:hypothetical protein
MGVPLDQWNWVWMQWDCRLSTGLLPSSRLCRLWSWKEDLQRAWDRVRRAVWDQAELSLCQHDCLVTVRDEARCRRGHNDQSHQGHQCSDTTLTGESRFHWSNPLGLNLGPSWQKANRWTYKLVELCTNAVRLQALDKEAIQRLQCRFWTQCLLPRLKQYYLENHERIVFLTIESQHYFWIC